MRLILLASVAILSTAVAYKTLSDDNVRSFPLANEIDFNIHNQQGLLAPILIPRVPGSEGSTKVQQHFARFFNDYLPTWKLEWQNSTSKTPTSNGQDVPFVNLIATRDPPWSDTGNVGRLALVAHYDSKMIPEGFIGAIDSAAPCAMLLHAARSIDVALTKKWEKMQADGSSEIEELKGVQILLLDGEEAFMSWTDTDSVYGARSLAEEWEKTLHPVGSWYRNPLRSIDLFMLLDLLGSAGSTVPSYFKTTHWAYKHLAELESRLRSAGRMKTGLKDVFLPDGAKLEDSYWGGGYIGDDHVPFMQRGVEILHLIAYNGRFPSVWHTINDDGEHLDMNTVLDWATLTSAFAAEWMELDEFMDNASASKSMNALFEKSELT